MLPICFSSPNDSAPPIVTILKTFSAVKTVGSMVVTFWRSAPILISSKRSMLLLDADPSVPIETHTPLRRSSVTGETPDESFMLLEGL